MNIRHNKKKYGVLDYKCIGRECLQLGEYQSRGAVLSGSRNTGNVSYECMRRAYHCCPHPLSELDEELMKKRKAEGYKNESKR